MRKTDNTCCNVESLLICLLWIFRKYFWHHDDYDDHGDLDHRDLNHGNYGFLGHGDHWPWHCVLLIFSMAVFSLRTDKAILGSRIIAKGTVFCYVSANSSPYILELHIWQRFHISHKYFRTYQTQNYFDLGFNTELFKTWI